MHKRNRILISESDQERMRDFKIVFGGLGLGSVIAEHALRMGFENLHLIDGDVVELSNLNRQNYELTDIGKPKCVAIYERLKRINPNANITYSNVFLTAENLSEHLAGASVAVNAIDFTSDIPMLFDDVCFEMNIPSVHPFNLGYGGLVCVTTKESANLRSLGETCKDAEVNMVKHVINDFEKKGVDMSVLKKVFAEYLAEDGDEPPPQLSLASAYVAGLCLDIFLKILWKKPVDVFPKFHYMDNNIKHS